MPVNTTAEVVIPASGLRVRAGGCSAAPLDGVQSSTSKRAHLTLLVGSGSYDFTYGSANAKLGLPASQLYAAQTELERLNTAGGVPSADYTATGNVLRAVQSRLTAAIQGNLSAQALVDQLAPATRSVGDQRLALSASPTLPAASRAGLDALLGALEDGLSLAYSAELGVRVTARPFNGRPGSTITTTIDIDIDNRAATDATRVAGWLQVPGWAPVYLGPTTIAKGTSAHLPVTVKIPADADPGSYPAEASVTATVGGKAYDVTDYGTGLVRVDPADVRIGQVTFTPATGDPVERGTLSVDITNNNGALPLQVRAEVTAGLPAGWQAVASPTITVPVNATATATIPIVAPHDRIGDTFPGVTIAVIRGTGDTVLASRPRCSPSA